MRKSTEKSEVSEHIVDDYEEDFELEESKPKPQTQNKPSNIFSQQQKQVSEEQQESSGGFEEDDDIDNYF